MSPILRKNGKISPLPTLPSVDSEGVVQPEPKKILERRMKKLGNHAYTEVLIKWLGAALEDSSLELLWNLKNLYPHLVGQFYDLVTGVLWDQGLKEVGIVTGVLGDKGLEEGCDVAL